MKSAFRPVTRNNSPPARRQHIAKVCYFPIGTRLNSRQSRKPTAPQSRKPVPPTEPEVRCFPFGNRPSAPLRKPDRPCRSRKLTPSSGAVHPLLPELKPTAPQSRKPVSPTEPETDRPAKQKARSSNRAGNPRPFRKPSPAPCQSRKLTPSSEAVHPLLPEPETDRPAKQKARSSNRTGSPLFPLWKPSIRPLPELETDRPQSRKPVPPTEPEVRCFPFGNRPSAPCQSRKLTPSSETRRFPFGSPDKTGKPFGAPPGQLFFLVRFADFSCARSRIPAILKPLFNPDRRRLYEKIWLNLCSRVRKRPKKSNLSKGLAHAS